MRRRNWKRVRMMWGDSQRQFQSQDAMVTCSPAGPQPALTSKHCITPSLAYFLDPVEGKRLWDILQSRPTKELLTKIPLTFCHRDCILPCFCSLLLMQISPYFYTLPAILLGIWGELGSVLTPITKSRDFKHCLWKTEHHN